LDVFIFHVKVHISARLVGLVIRIHNMVIGDILKLKVCYFSYDGKSLNL